MSTQIVNPVRSDLTIPEVETTTARTRSPRAWAVAGLAAGVAALASVKLSMELGPVYDLKIGDDPAAITAALADRVPQLVALHVVTTLTLLAITAFGFGLFRRLRDALPAGSLVPGVALFGTLSTAVVMVVGTGLNTEFIYGVSHTEAIVPESAVFYDHWINTMPSVWMLIGLAALAVYAAARRGAVARWLGRVSLGLGALTVLVGIAPLQYMAMLTGALWLVVVGLGLALGDRASRA